MENTSGQGKQAVIPTELKGWNWGAFLMNWGAFLMNWVWGIFNKTYIALLTFVPLIGMFMPFVLGFKGNAWAWRNKRWESIDHFRKVQRKWAMWGVIMFIFSLVASAGAVFFLFETLKSSEPYVMAVDKAQVSGEVQSIIGAPMKPGWWMVGDISTAGTGGKAEFSIPVEGSKNKGTIFVKATKTSNKWKLDQLYLLPEGGGTSIDLLKVPQPRPPSPGQVKQPPQEAPPMDTPPPDREAMQPGKVADTPVVAAGKAAKDTVAAKKAAPAAAPVSQPGKTAVAEKKPAVAETIPAPKERQATNKPKKKYAKKSVSKGRTAATAKEKTTADLGRAEITAGDYQGAIKTLSAAIAKNPRESVNYRLRGNAYDNLGKREQAIEDWKKAAALGDRIIQSYLLYLQVEWP